MEVEFAMARTTGYPKRLTMRISKCFRLRIEMEIDGE